MTTRPAVDVLQDEVEGWDGADPRTLARDALAALWDAGYAVTPRSVDPPADAAPTEADPPDATPTRPLTDYEHRVLFALYWQVRQTERDATAHEVARIVYHDAPHRRSWAARNGHVGNALHVLAMLGLVAMGMRVGSSDWHYLVTAKGRQALGVAVTAAEARRDAARERDQREYDELTS